MRKVFFFFFCLSAWSVNPAIAEKIRINLGCQKIDNKPIGEGHSKAPMRMPIIYQDGYTLSLSTFHPEYIINIVQEDEVIYSDIILEGMTEFELPNYLSGNYQIQFISEDRSYYGQIDL